MKSMKKLVVVMMLVLIVGAMTGCGIKPYDTPELVTIEPSQTAFLIPLVGDSEQQGAFESEEMLAKSKVPSKEIQIPHRWVQTGRMQADGQWIRSARLIIVERKPETREWTESSSNGTSTKNEGITAESKESIAFMARMNISAQIDETDAVKFLYRYNNKPLTEIMDTEIRAMVESSFVEACSTRTMDEIIVSKSEILQEVKDVVLPYFKDRGITITVLGMKGELTYLNQKIQDSIDAKFKAKNDLETQKTENERVLSKAQADAEAVRIQSESIEKSLELKKIEVQEKAVDKWDGKLPTQYTNVGSEGTVMNLPLGGNQ